jgi:hypothetical protein
VRLFVDADIGVPGGLALRLAMPTIAVLHGFVGLFKMGHFLVITAFLCCNVAIPYLFLVDEEREEGGNDRFVDGEIVVQELCLVHETLGKALWKTQVYFTSNVLHYIMY